MYKKIMKELVKYFIVCGILIIIDIIWKLLELIEFGKAMPSVSDSIIGIILAFSLYKNLNIKIDIN